jgi:hypothetical protein
MKSPAAAARPATTSAIVAILLAAGLSLAAGLLCRSAWRRLPNLQIAASEAAKLTAAREAALKAGSREARDGFLAMLLARQAQRLGRPDFEAATAELEIGAIARNMTASGLGRLHQAAARIAALEQAGSGVEAWWPAVRPMLQGLEAAPLNHHYAAIEPLLARAYESTGLSPAAAQNLATLHLVPTHGAFLQAFASQMTRIAQHLKPSDAAASKLSEVLTLRLLRDWTLEPGPIGLRLLAADLLAERLDADAASAELARSLRAWTDSVRRGQRAAAADWLSAAEGVTVDPDANRAARRNLVVSSALVGANLLLAAIGLVIVVPAWLAARRGECLLPTARHLAGLEIALLAASAVLLVALLRPDWVATDQRLLLVWAAGGDAAREPAHGTWHASYWWHIPVIAAGAAALLLLCRAAWCATRPRGSRIGAFSASVVRAWLVSGALALLAVAASIRTLDRQLAALTASARKGEAALILGDDAEKPLAGLRAWRPPG